MPLGSPFFSATPAAQAHARVDWAQTGVGPLAAWPQALHTAASVVMGLRFPSLLLWGEQFVVIHNDAFVALLGDQAPRAAGARASELWGERWPALESLVAPVRSGRRCDGAEQAPLPFDLSAAADDARYTYSIAPIANDDGANGGVLVTAFETTALHRAENGLHQLRELDRVKTAFFTTMSHELRTPLTLMTGPLGDAMRSGSLRGDDLAVAHRNSRRLLGLVNGLLDTVRLEAGQMRPRFMPVDVQRLTQDIAAGFRSAFDRAALRLEVDCMPVAGDVWLDVEMYSRIVSNLLVNALNFTPDGLVSLRLRDVGDVLRVEVQDTGIGIAEHEISRVFERFQRVESGWARAREGSGIGLAMVADLVRLHDGSVSVRSQPGVGSTFTVSLPKGRRAAAHDDAALSAATFEASHWVEETLGWALHAIDNAAARESAPNVVAPNAAHLLIVDDNADMRDYLARLLGARWHVQAVPDAAAAIRSIDTRLPDLLLCDVMLRGTSGFSVVTRLRGEEKTRQLPVILMSARAGEDARLEGLAAGADDYLTKPFSPRELLARVETQLIRSRLAAMDTEFTRRLVDVFRDAPVGIALLRGRRHVFEFANEESLKIWGGRLLAGRTIREALPELQSQGFVDLLDGVLDTGEPVMGRSVRILMPQSATGAEAVERFFDFTFQPLRDLADGPVNGVAVVVYDVTALTQARREAIAANRAKDEFLAILGHELRNPLAPIQATLQLMRMRRPDVFDDERSVIERQVQHLVRLVDDMLDVSRIVRGMIDLKRAPTDLRDAVARGVELAEPLLAQQRHALTMDIEREPLWVHADSARLAQIVSNLLNNAAKYTPTHGRVAVSAKRRGGSIELSVSDNGVGIDAAMLPKVFDMFAQESQSLERAKGGLGLGLTIVRSLVELHGGVVGVESPGRGQGATFTVSLPAHTAPVESAAPVAPVAQAANVRTPRVMIVDDNVDAADSLAALLQACGFETAVAHDGAHALGLARGFGPSIALLDIGLPGMDGYELARRLRTLHNELRLYALTGYGGAGDRQRSREAGFDGHFVKPVDFQTLLETLQS